jgi:hypothetical protein
VASVRGYGGHVGAPIVSGQPLALALAQPRDDVGHDTPAAVTTLPCTTTRCNLGRAPRSRSCSSEPQCVVARSPRNTPAAPSSSEPVQTDVVHWLVSCAVRIQSSNGFGGVVSARVPKPPGTIRISGRGTADSGSSAIRVSWRWSVRYGPGVIATNRTRAPGRRERTS